eukprot:351094-Chlamydomonas_euryale.AAC.2
MLREVHLLQGALRGLPAPRCFKRGVGPSGDGQSMFATGESTRRTPRQGGEWAVGKPLTRTRSLVLIAI